MIPVLKPTADEQTKKELVEVIESGWWGQGPKVKELEETFAKLVGTQYAVATSSCTSALDLVIKAYGINDGELITTPMTFVSDAIVGEWNNMDVTFADIDEETLCLDPETVVITPQTKVIIPVHSHGRLADVRGLRTRFKGLIIEDCAHCVPGYGAGKQGGDIAVWSFQAVKVVPGGDGGMITTDSEEIYHKLRNMSWLGVQKSTYARVVGSKKYAWDYDIIHGGLKAYMNDINAVLILGGLRRLDEIVAKRQRIQKKYNNALISKGIKPPEWSNSCQYYTVKVDNRDDVGEHLAEAGITTSVHFKPLSEMTYWKKAVKRPLPVTDMVWKRLLSLPCHDALTDEEQDYIINKFYEALR